MLVTMKEILAIAEEKKIAVGAFNSPNLECIMAVIGAAEEGNYPVMITHAEVHESVMPIDVIGPIMIMMAKNAKVPVCVHLDHGDSLAYIEHALELGFTSIMYDGSALPYEENVATTRQAVALARKYGASIEAEIGTLGGRESGSEPDPNEEKEVAIYTEPADAKRFVEDTGIDALAASFGTAHGFYRTKPQLDFERIETINKLVDVPLVMHGGSGVSPEDYKTAIGIGVRKINYYSYMARAGVRAIADKLAKEEVQFFPDLAFVAVEAMKKDAKKAMDVFSQ